MNKNLTWHTYGKKHIQLWISKIPAIIWLIIRINANEIIFLLDSSEQQILRNPVSKIYDLQWSSIGYIRTMHATRTLSWEANLKVRTTVIPGGSCHNFQNLWRNQK